MPFSTQIKVRFADVDAAGLVYFPVLFHYCHVAMEEFFAARCGVTYDRLMAEDRLGFPTVNAQAEFFEPFLYGDAVEAEVTVDRVGRTSVTFEYRLRRASDQTLCSSFKLIQVAMNLDTRRAVPVPDDLRRAFAQGDD
jgi:4-hydroxybenzoyl-CoA thioesterase